jgi:ketosteroid isomerase-like protein
VTDHPNALRMREAVNQFMAGDMESFLSGFAEDIVWRTGGNNALAGTYRGRGELARWFETWNDWTGGTHRITPVDVLADDDHLVLFLHISAQRDGETLDVEVANAFRVDAEGRWKESWWLADDQAAVDSFFS